jgi:two-component system NarL family sensor kinase
MQMHCIRNITTVVVSVLMLTPLFATAQAGNAFEKNKQAAIDELRKFPTADTNRVNALLKILNTAVYLKEKKQVLFYLEEARELSRTLNYKTGLGNAYLQQAAFFKSASDYRNAIHYYDSALFIAGNNPDWDLLAIKELALEQKGVVYYTQENYYPALDYLFEALNHIRPDREQRKLRIYTFITLIYTALNDFEKAEEYVLKNIALAEQGPNGHIDETAYFAYIDICLAKNDLKTASAYLDKMSAAIPDPNQVQNNFGYYLKRGRISFQQKRHLEAYSYFQKAHQYAVEGGHINSINASLYYLSMTALELGYKEEAKRFALENLEVTEKMKSTSRKVDALLVLASYYDKEGNTAKAYHMMEQAIQLKDSFIVENNMKQLNVLGSIYEYGKQQTVITKLLSEKEKQLASAKLTSLLNKLFIASILVLLILGYLGYTNFKKNQQLTIQQQSIQEQKIKELEKNKQLLTINAMLKGQEEERGRIAKDLHDGLGSLLSGTKLSFSNIKESLNLSAENNLLFEKSLRMLDNTIGDLRIVAQNLMPEALVKFGLYEAMRDFCDSIQSTSGINMIYQQYGEQRKLDSTAEVFTYRIVQELVNNAVKHAQASEIIVQITVQANKLGIAVEDNGKGFDKEMIPLTKSSGLANIKYRVEYFNGTCDIVTSPDNGTSVTIELKA